MPTCPTCKQDKPKEAFYASSNGGYCKPCSVTRNYHARLKRLYKISPEAYYEKLREQDGVCAICHKPDPRGWQLSVDHNHETGCNRDLLCVMCNSILGLAKDDTAVLEAAIKYLQKWSEGQTWQSEA